MYDNGDDGQEEEIIMREEGGGRGSDVFTLEMKLIHFQSNLCLMNQPQREHLHQILGEYADRCQFMFVKKKVIHLTGRRDVVQEVKRKIESFLHTLV
jgi:hypothetical protein